MSAREENIRIRIESISDLPDLASQMDELIRLTKQQQEITQQSALAARTGAIQQVTAIEGVTDALRKQQKAQRDSDDEATNSRKKIADDLDKLGGQVRSFTTLISAAFTLSEIKSFGLDIIEAKTKIDQLKISLDVMLGSKKESALLYADIVKLAKETPFTLEEVAEQTVRLKAYNIATADLIPTVNALGNIAAAVGKDKLPQLTLAYGQVATANRLMLTELRQFQEAGVPLIELISTAYGKTRDEVQKMADAHQISFDMVRRAIMAASEENGKYFNLMALQTKTVGGEVDKLKDSYVQAKVLIGDYFEDTIQSGTRRLNELLEATVGSNSAIARTLDIVKSAASAVIALTIATKGQNVVDGIATAYQTAKTIAYGEYLIALKAVTGQQVAFTAVEAEAVVAAEAFNVAMKANWIGLAVTAIAGLVSAYYAYSAATDDVTTSIGEQQVAVKSEQTELNGLAKAAMSAAEGTKERKDAIDLLVSKYPEYFSGIDDEKTSNNQLRTILDKVNGSYMTRISLARQAYKLEGLQDEIKKNLKEEAEILAAFPADLQAKYGGDINKAVSDLFANPALFSRLREDWKGEADFNMTQAKAVADNLTRLGAEQSKAELDIQKSNAVARAAEILAIKENYKVQRDQAEGNSKEIKRINAEEKEAIAKINGEARGDDLKGNNDFQEKTKTVILSSAKERAAILKSANADTYEEQVKALKAQEAAELEAAGKAVVAKDISEKALQVLKEASLQKQLAIQEEYAQKLAALKLKHDTEERENFSRSLDVDIAAALKGSEALQHIETVNLTTHQLTAKELLKSDQELARLRAELIEVHAKQEAATAVSSLLLSADTEEKRHDILVNVGKRTGDELAVQELARLKIQKDNLFLLSEQARLTYGKDSENYREKLDAFLNADKQYSEASTQLQTQLQGKILQIWQQQEQRKKQLTEEAIQGILQALQTFAQSTQQLGEMSVKGLQEQMQVELATYADNFTKRAEIIADYAAKEEQVLYSTQASQKITTFLASALSAFQSYNDQRSRIAQDYSLKVQEIDATMNLNLAAGMDASLAKEQATAATSIATQQQKQQEIAAGISAGAQFLGSILQANFQAEVQAAQAEIQIAKQKHDATITLLQDQADTAKAINAQSTADKLTALETDFNNQKAALDKQFADGLLTKEAYEAASTALSKKYTEQTTAVKADGATKEAQIQKQLTVAKAQADAEYNDKVRELNSKQFNAQRDMAKAQIAIALVVGAAQLFAINPILGIIGAFAAVGAGVYLFEKLNSIPNPYDGSTSSGGGIGGIDGANIVAIGPNGEAITGFDKSGNPIYATGTTTDYADPDPNADVESLMRTRDQIEAEQKGLEAKKIRIANELAALQQQLNGPQVDEYGNPIDYAPIQAQYDSDAAQLASINPRIQHLKDLLNKYYPLIYQKGGHFAGSDYLELNGNPKGRDTIPTWVNEGERILPTDKNLAIGGRNLTNEALVGKIKAHDLLMAQFPHLQMPKGSSGLLRLPAGIMNSAGGSLLDVGGLRSDLKGVQRAIENQKLLNVNIDRNGTAIYEMELHSKINHYSTLFNR